MFSEIGSKVDSDLYLAHNDSYMKKNPHSIRTAHAWRGNVDQSAVINYMAAVNYMVKYATKSK